MKTINVDTLLHNYSSLLSEIISQRAQFTTEQDFWFMWAKIASRVNQLQGYKLRHI